MWLLYKVMTHISRSHKSLRYVSNSEIWHSYNKYIGCNVKFSIEWSMKKLCWWRNFAKLFPLTEGNIKVKYIILQYKIFPIFKEYYSHIWSSRMFLSVLTVSISSWTSRPSLWPRKWSLIWTSYKSCGCSTKNSAWGWKGSKRRTGSSSGLSIIFSCEWKYLVVFAMWHFMSHKFSVTQCMSFFHDSQSFFMIFKFFSNFFFQNFFFLKGFFIKNLSWFPNFL